MSPSTFVTLYQYTKISAEMFGGFGALWAIGRPLVICNVLCRKSWNKSGLSVREFINTRTLRDTEVTKLPGGAIKQKNVALSKEIDKCCFTKA